EASLVKSLEAHSIGRPSTYASIIETLRYRHYVEMSGRAFVPTDIGKIVSKFLVKYLGTYVDYGFTALMEDALDEISNGEKEWHLELGKFWKPFTKQVQHITKSVSREEVAESRLIGTDPESGKPIAVRMGQYGPFVQCGTRDDEEKPRFASLLPGALEIVAAKVKSDRERTIKDFPEAGIQVLKGRYGPYATDKKRNAKVPK